MNRSEIIAIVDDDSEMRRATKRSLKSKGFENFEEADRGEGLIEILNTKCVDLILLDITMPGMGGIKTLEFCVEHHTEIPVVMITGRLEAKHMLECIQCGAYDYITKPFDLVRLLTTVEKALQHRATHSEIIDLQGQLYKEGPENASPFSEMITESSAMNRLFAYAESSAKSNRDILITGETGTGKDLMARALHKLSGRPGEYIAVNAAGLDDQLFADTLFGHLEGAFTGAQGKRAGLIELAKDGTLFLDEIGDLSIPSQVKLLRVLQEREYMPLGSDRPFKTTARVIAATSVNLEKKMEDGSFRKDLFFRLSAHHLSIPPLRKRKGDIRLLFDHFLEKCLSECQKNLSESIPPHVYALLEIYPFKGNIRELEAMVYDLVYRMEQDRITLLDVKNALKFEKKKDEGLNAEILTADEKIESDHQVDFSDDTKVFMQNQPDEIIFPETLPTVDQCTDSLIIEALKRCGGNKTRASQIIGMSRKGLINRLAKINDGD